MAKRTWVGRKAKPAINLWLIFAVVWALIAAALNHANPDLPAVVWIMAYWFPLTLTAICLAMATEKR